jgi:hypothetical protein
MIPGLVIFTFGPPGEGGSIRSDLSSSLPARGELTCEWTRFSERLKRLRNALAHGGPPQDEGGPGASGLPGTQPRRWRGAGPVGGSAA